MILFITADRVGLPTGGGAVTANEQIALRDAFPGEPVLTVTLDHKRQWPDPFAQDWNLLEQVQELVISTATVPRLAHCYAGCLDETVKYLQSLGTVVTYTVDAHDEQVSRQEHERLQVPFPYPHLVDPDLFKRYIGGYINADHVIVPGTAPRETVKRQGRTGPITIIPHGHVPPDPKKLKPPPTRFTVGYLGAYGPDKGVAYLLNAWRLLGYKDATLVLAGRDSTSPWVRHMVSTQGAGNVQMVGYVADVSDFYGSLSLYVQPSACLLPGSLVYSGRGMVPINELTSQDTVLVDDGSYQKVIKPLRRRFSGELVCVRTTGFGESVAMTAAHRLLVIKRGLEKRKAEFSRRRAVYEQAMQIRQEKGWGARRVARELQVNESMVSGWFHAGTVPHDGHCGALRSLKEEVADKAPQWIPARELEKGDVVLFPRPRHESQKQFIKLPIKKTGSYTNRTNILPDHLELDQDVMQFFGFYVSEGCATDGGDVVFCFHSDEEDYVDFTRRFITDRLGLSSRVRKHQSKSVVTVAVSSVLLSRFLIQHFGRGAHNKTLPLWCLTLSQERLAALIRGAWLGDGSSWQARRKRRDTSYSTVSKQLAYQLFYALVRLGFMPKLQTSRNAYYVTCHGNDSLRFSEEVLGRDVSDIRAGERGTRTHIDGAFYYMPVTDVSRIAYVGDVFNLEVEQNHCYCAPFVVHNSEGFGIEVVEAMAHGRPVLCSYAAGAADVIPLVGRFPSCRPESLARSIDYYKSYGIKAVEVGGMEARQAAQHLTWDRVRERYVTFWRGLFR